MADSPSRRSRRRTRTRRGKQGHVPPRERNRLADAAIIGLGILLGVAMLFSFPAQDRLMLAFCEVAIVGLGLVLYGSVMAMEKSLADIDERLHRDRGPFQRRRLVPLRVLESILLIGVVVGFFRVFVQPRQTWPALSWILSGMAVIALTLGVGFLLDR